jgi:uncharacterized membrane protein
MAAFPAIFLLFPVINYLARSWGLSAAVWAAVVFQLFLVIIMDMAYGAHPVLFLIFPALISILSVSLRRNLYICHHLRAE